jgi:hypothetical protein
MIYLFLLKNNIQSVIKDFMCYAKELIAGINSYQNYLMDSIRWSDFQDFAK